MPKRQFERGILGMKKDPANQVLFSFCVREGDECPASDSEDSDYMPSDTEITYQKKPGRKKAPTKVLPKRNKTKVRRIISSDEEDSLEGDCATSDHGDTSAADSPMPGSPNLPADTNFLHKDNRSTSEKIDKWGQCIPPEILLHIFRDVVQQVGAIPFLISASSVCSLWHDVSLTPSLWEVVDLSYGWVKSSERTLRWLCANRLSCVRTLDLSRWGELTDNGVGVLVDACPLLENLNLSHCKKLQSGSTKHLTNGNIQLKKLDYSFISKDATSGNLLKQLILKHSPQLQCLNVSGNSLVAFNLVMNAIADECSSLEVLDISNCRFSSDFITLNVEKLQQGCPKLQILRLANSSFRSTAASVRLQAESPGFPDLEELSVAKNTASSGMFHESVSLGMDGSTLCRILKASHKLRLLDVRGCTNLTMRDLISLPVTDLQYLYMSRCSAVKDTGLNALLSKWQHSLLDLDLAWNIFPETSLQDAIQVLVDAARLKELKLHTLSLAGTAVEEKDVNAVVRTCTSIQELDLNSCRGLPRGWKREYTGKAMDKFRRSLYTNQPVIQEDTDQSSD